MYHVSAPEMHQNHSNRCGILHRLCTQAKSLKLRCHVFLRPKNHRIDFLMNKEEITVAKFQRYNKIAANVETIYHNLFLCDQEIGPMILAMAELIENELIE